MKRLTPGTRQQAETLILQARYAKRDTDSQILNSENWRNLNKIYLQLWHELASLLQIPNTGIDSLIQGAKTLNDYYDEKGKPKSVR